MIKCMVLQKCSCADGMEFETAIYRNILKPKFSEALKEPGNYIRVIKKYAENQWWLCPYFNVSFKGKHFFKNTYVDFLGNKMKTCR